MLPTFDAMVDAAPMMEESGMKVGCASCSGYALIDVMASDIPWWLLRQG